MKWFKVKVTQDIPVSFGCEYLKAGTIAWAAKRENLVRIYSDKGGHINCCTPEAAKTHLEYVKDNGKYIHHKQNDLVNDWWVSKWNKLMY